MAGKKSPAEWFGYYVVGPVITIAGLALIVGGVVAVGSWFSGLF